MASSALAGSQPTVTDRQLIQSAVVRFAGDSGDGMQITGSQFTQSTALAGNDLATFPDFPAEIRAPQGTLFGVSAFQINFGSRVIKTAGDQFDMLVAMNPAALRVELKKLKKGGVIIADTGAFVDKNLRKAKYGVNPLEDGSLADYRVIALDITKFTMEAVKESGLGNKDAQRCKNFWTLGFVYWMYGRDRRPTADWLKSKFARKPELAEANIAAMNAGHMVAETVEMPDGVSGFLVEPAKIGAGLYRTVTGGEALAWGLAAGAKLAGLPMIFASYPITPASPLLHTLSTMADFNVTTFQAEDEIAAACAAIGASYAGSLGVTSSSGPGVALKTEAIGLAISTELPLVVVNVQRAGPSTGMPTKTEQSDLYQAVYGRNGDAPVPVLAIRSPSDCFETAIEACRLATKYMTPVYLLADGYISNAAEPWKIPDMDAYEPFPVTFHKETEGFHPFLRDEKTLGRVWAKPGTPGLEHRIGGLEKDYDSGHISYDPDNHQKMTDTRAEKILRIADDIPPQDVEDGDATGKLAVVGWGSTYGPISRAVANLRAQGQLVSHIHLRHIWPLPKNLSDLLSGFEHVIVPEMNNGQLLSLLRGQLLIEAEGLNKVSGQPFKIGEIEAVLIERLEA